MLKITRRHLIGGLGALVLSVVAPLAQAQSSYPSNPVTVVVPFAAGGGVDILTRILAQHLSEKLGEPVVVENRPGAAGALGVQLVAQAEPDGYTLVMATTGTHTINPGLYKDLPYDPLKDFAPITTVASVPNLLVVNPDVPADSVEELVELARSKPGELKFGSFGPGTSNHLSGELMKHLAKLDIVHVPYRKAPEGVADLISGQIDMLFVNTPLGLPHVQSGRMRALAVSGAKRSATAPELPTMSEAGVEGFVVESWYGLFAPAGTPEPVISKLHDAVAEVLARPDVQAFFAKQGAETLTSTPAEISAAIEAEIPRWKEIIEISGTTAE